MILIKLLPMCEHSFEVVYILSNPHPEWTGLTGRVRKDILEEFIVSSGEEDKLMFCACGPTPFTEEAVR